MPTPQDAGWVGKTIAQYEILEPLGHGGMGTVYRARDTKLGRDVAIKVIARGLDAPSTSLERFEREARTLAGLNHPSIATVYGLETQQQRSFLVMELIEGETLDARIPANGLDEAPLLDLAVPLADALAEAHRSGVVHRDLKPANIMISSAGRLKVLDFGLAKWMPAGEPGSHPATPDEPTRSVAEELTRQGSVVGTLPYMSPEQLKGQPVDARSDVFSLGAVLYVMATGRHPFAAKSRAELASAILRDSPLDAHQLNPRIPVALAQLIARCLAKAPDERPENAAAVHSALSLLRHPVGGSKHHGKGSRSTINIAGISLLAVATVASFWWLSQREPTPAATAPPRATLARLAVLPFAAIDPEDMPFAEGLTTELTSHLAGLRNLAVISRSSTTHYRDTETPPSKIGRELGANYLLAGSIQRDDSQQFRIESKLIRVSDSNEVWSRTYKPALAKQSAIQSEIATQVTGELGIALSDDEIRRLQAAPTANALAYEAYLQGLQRLPRGHGSEENYRQGQKLLEQAVSLDPEFALAWCKLAEGHLGMYWFGYDVTESRMEQALAAIREAQRIDAELPEARFMLSDYYYRRRDYGRAQKEVAAVYAVRPNDPDVLSHIAYIWRRQGLFEPSAENLERALQLNPRDVSARVELSHTMLLMANYDRAIELNREVLAIEPTNEWGNVLLALTFWLRGGPDDLANARESLAHYPAPRSAYPAALRIQQAVYDGDFDAARRLISNLSVPAVVTQGDYAPSSLLTGFVELADGNQERARTYLEEAVEILGSEIADNPADSRLQSALGLAHAALGQREEALGAGERGMELLPYSSDALLGLRRVFDMARIHALLGENDDALEHLKFVLSRPNERGGLMLRLAPEFAELRKDPRFWELPAGYHVPRQP